MTGYCWVRGAKKKDDWVNVKMTAYLMCNVRSNLPWVPSTFDDHALVLVTVQQFKCLANLTGKNTT